MTQTFRQERGRAAEQMAVAYLRREGYEIQATNVRFKVGELDVVAREGETLCFLEVRSRTSEQFGSALESITPMKRRRFIRAVRWYLARRRRPWLGPMRFDVVAIQHRQGAPPSLTLLRDAFTADS